MAILAGLHSYSAAGIFMASLLLFAVCLRNPVELTWVARRTPPLTADFVRPRGSGYEISEIAGMLRC